MSALDNILPTDPVTGRALLTVPDWPIRYLLPNHRRDFREIGKVRQWLVGPITPGMTWLGGIFVSLFWLSYRLGWKQLADLVRFILHETGHWWQLWKRMGPDDFPATYGWQAILTRFKTGSAHLHDNHPVEHEAIAMAAGMMDAAQLAWGAAGSPADFVFDTEPWLQAHYPAMR